MKITDEMIEKMFIKSIEETHDVDFDGTYLSCKDYWKKEYALFKAAISLLLPIIERQAEAIECYSKGHAQRWDDKEYQPEGIIEYLSGKLARQTQKEVIEMLNKITEATK